MRLTTASFIRPLTLCAALTLISPAVVRARETAAQDPRGALTGRVEDPAGAVIPDAEVRATNAATGVSVSGRTSSAGVYSIPFVQSGIYSVTVDVPGFRTFVREHIYVRVSETVEVNGIDVRAFASAVEARRVPVRARQGGDPRPTAA
jgi:Carboxypeptidase regulatory-like domain